MTDRRAHAQERRKDRRIPVAARVRIAPREGSGILLADLVDVSAGGLRATCALPAVLTCGADVDVEITVQDAPSGSPPPLVNLRGQGRVLRVEEGEGEYAAALAFTGALALSEPFSQMLLL